MWIDSKVSWSLQTTIVLMKIAPIKWYIMVILCFLLMGWIHRILIVRENSLEKAYFRMRQCLGPKLWASYRVDLFDFSSIFYLNFMFRYFMFFSFTQDLNSIQDSRNTSTGSISLTHIELQRFNIYCRIDHSYFFHFYKLNCFEQKVVWSRNCESDKWFDL